MVALPSRRTRAWLIVDDTVFEKPDYPRELVAVGDSPADLETRIGSSRVEVSKARSNLYNRHAAAGEAIPMFHKHHGLRHSTHEGLPTEPSTALPRARCTRPSRWEASARTSMVACSTPSRSAIKGLYGAGRATSGLSVGSYSSGLSLGDGTFFGRRAGRCAAAELRSRPGVPTGRTAGLLVTPLDAGMARAFRALRETSRLRQSPDNRAASQNAWRLEPSVRVPTASLRVSGDPMKRMQNAGYSGIECDWYVGPQPQNCASSAFRVRCSA